MAAAVSNDSVRAEFCSIAASEPEISADDSSLNTCAAPAWLRRQSRPEMMFAASCTRPISLTVVNTDPPLASSLIFWTIVGISASSALAADTALRSEEHTSELQSLMRISYAVFCLKKKNNDDQLFTT